MATHSSILAWRIPVDRGAWQATVDGALLDLQMCSLNPFICGGLTVVFQLILTSSNLFLASQL